MPADLRICRHGVRGSPAPAGGRIDAAPFTPLLASLLAPLRAPLFTLLLAASLTGCEWLETPAAARHPVPTPAPAPAPAPPPPPPVEIPKPDLAGPVDQITRRLLEYSEHVLQMTPTELSTEIDRLDGEVAHTSSAAAPDVLLDQALALAQQHGPGDLARASGLLEAITQAQSLDMQPWRPIARLLAAQIGEQRRLEDLLEQQAAQKRDTQRVIQQLNEKLEALKAIERSMNTRSGSAPKPPPAEPPTPARQP